MPPHLRFLGARRVPEILQAEASECGLACLAMIGAYHGTASGLSELRRAWPAPARGLTLEQLIAIASTAGLESRALRLEPDELRRLRVPCILHWRMNHFVVMERLRGGSLRIIDPAIGRLSVPLRRVSSLFTGVALELSPQGALGPRRRMQRPRLRDWLRHSPGALTPFAQVLALSLAIQVFTLAMPFYLQLAIDHVILSRDSGLMLLLLLAFATLAVVHTAVAALRSWVVFYFGTRLGYGWTCALFRHLLRLPQSWFDRRGTGDIQSRFAAILPVRELIASKAVEAVVDGMLAATTAAVIVVYSPSIAVIVCASAAVYAALRFIMFPFARRRNRQQIVASARTETFLLETIRCALTIRSLGLDSVRAQRYGFLLGDAFDAAARLRRLSIVENGAEFLLFSLVHVGVVYLGVTRVIDHSMTVGMLMAILAYSGQFATRAIAVVRRVLEFRLSTVHLERIADITEAEPESVSAVPATPAVRRQRLRGAISLHDVAFRYSRLDPWILDGVSFAVRAGESVAITAPSGFGKSTLLKLLAGLLPCAQGEIRYDGIALSPANASRMRRDMGTVLQDDRLLSGTLAQNIAGFDTTIDMDRVRDCAARAAIADDIRRMPMGFMSVIGDVGDQLSAGQRQRVFLARALYRRPAILLLDEATSNIDAATERHIATALADLPMTRIVVTHRRETVDACDRVVCLDRLVTLAQRTQDRPLRPRRRCR